MVKESLIVSIDIEAQMSLVFIIASVLVVLLGCRLFVEWKNTCFVYYKNILLICMMPHGDKSNYFLIYTLAECLLPWGPDRIEENAKGSATMQ